MTAEPETVGRYEPLAGVPERLLPAVESNVSVTSLRLPIPTLRMSSTAEPAGDTTRMLTSLVCECWMSTMLICT